MITLNGVKFALNDKEFIDSLFQSGGTCSGYYKVLKRKVKILNHNKELIGVVCNGVLGKATLLDNGKYWYSYGDIDLIGSYKNYNDKHKDISKVMNLLK